MNKYYKILRIGNTSLIGIINSFFSKSFIYAAVGKDSHACLLLFIIWYISDQINV